MGEGKERGEGRKSIVPILIFVGNDPWVFDLTAEFRVD
jgi:hypothetical protein